MTPVISTLLAAATDATAAVGGWLSVPAGDGLEIVAAYENGQHAPSRLGRIFTGPGSVAGFVCSSGQPMALRPRPDDDMRRQGPSADAGLETESVAAVACEHDGEILGVLEVVNKVGGGGFAFDDVELLTLLAPIAGAALASTISGSGEPRQGHIAGAAEAPEQLATRLGNLLAHRPHTYAALAQLIADLTDRP